MIDQSLNNIYVCWNLKLIGRAGRVGGELTPKLLESCEVHCSMITNRHHAETCSLFLSPAALSLSGLRS